MTTSAPPSAEHSAPPSRPTLGDRDFEPRHRADVYWRVRRRLPTHEDAEDVAQETMLKAWRLREGYDGRASVRTWLWCIADSCVADFYQRNRRNDVELMDVHTDPAPSPLRHIESAQALAGLDQCKLSTRERKALKLQIEDDYSARQIAWIMGSTEGAIRVLLCKARGKLRAAA